MKIKESHIDRELVRRFGFKKFCELAFPHTIQNNYVHSKHIDVIAEYCQDIWDGKIKRGVINVPPASGKSTIISVLYPAWCWIMDPTYKICTVSYSPEISTFFAIKTLDLIQSDWFQERWPIKIKSKSKVARGNYFTEQGGRRVSTSIGSKITGLHFHSVFIDDPLKASDKLARHDEVREYFKETLPTRLIDQNEGKIVCIMQRLKPYDVSAYLLESGWNSLILPMEFVPEKADPRDFRSQRGEILNPRIGPEALENLKIALGDYSFAQLQQDPIDVNECIFKQDYFNDVFVPPVDIPKLDKYILSVDPAMYAKSTSDYSAIVLLGKKKNPEMYYVIDAWRYKQDFADLSRTLEILVQNETKNYGTLECIIENKALGPSLVSQLKAKLPVKEYQCPTKSKEERAHGITHLFRNSRIRISDKLKGEYLKELQEFPNTKHDDQVDATIQGLTYLSDTPMNYWSTLNR